MPTLEERYFNHNSHLLKEIEIEKKEQKKREEELRSQKKFQAALKEYETALTKLNDYSRANLMPIGSNLYIINKGGSGMIMPIGKEDFEEDLSDRLKNKYYSIIRTVLCANTKDCDKNYISYHPSRYLEGIYGNVFEPAIKILYELSNGNFITLRTLFNLCLEIITESEASSKPYVILAEKDMHIQVIKFLEMFSGSFLSFVDFNELTTLNELHKLSREYHFGRKVAVAINSKIPETEFSVNKLTKIMSGKEISIKDPLFPGYLHFVFKIPFVYITDSHLMYRKLKTIYGAIDLKIHSKNLDKLRFDAHTMGYLRYKLHYLRSKIKVDKDTLTSVSMKITNDDIFKDFVENCCLLDEDAFCEKASLYEAYSEYYKKNFGDEPLTKITFSKKFAIFGNFETIRPHSSRKCYPYCFKGIKLDKKKMEQLTNQVTVRYSTTYETFRETLIKLFTEKKENEF